MSIHLQWKLDDIKHDISSCKLALQTKADSHEITSLTRRLDSLEHSVREICSQIDSILYRLQELEMRPICECETEE